MRIVHFRGRSTPGLHPGSFSAVPAGLISLANPTQDYALGYSQPSLRDYSCCQLSSQYDLLSYSVVPSGLVMLSTLTQDYVLGYSQPILRDCSCCQALTPGHLLGYSVVRSELFVLSTLTQDYILGYSYPPLRGLVHAVNSSESHARLLSGNLGQIGLFRSADLDSIR